MKYLYVILPLLLISCNGEKKQDSAVTSSSIITASDEKADDNTVDPYMFLNANSDSTIIWVKPKDEDVANQVKLELTTISEEEYESYDTTSSKLSNRLAQETKSSFTLKIKGEEWCFKKEPDLPNGEARANERWSEYIGYYPDLKLHAVRSCAVSGDLQGFGDVFLIDEESGYKYAIMSSGDYCEGTPVFSPNNKYMVITDNTYNDEKGYLNLFQVFKVNRRDKLTELLTYFNESNPFELKPEKIVWVNDVEFVVKGYTQEWIDKKEVKKYYYRKVTLP